MMDDTKTLMTFEISIELKQKLESVAAHEGNRSLSSLIRQSILEHCNKPSLLEERSK